MTTAPATDALAPFEFDQADRLRRALRVADVSVQEMAEHLEVSRNTIGSWINGRSRPRRRDLRLFALRTGYPVAWLESGELPDLDSNQEPAGNEPGRLVVLLPARRRPVIARPAAVAA